MTKKDWKADWPKPKTLFSNRLHDILPNKGMSKIGQEYFLGASKNTVLRYLSGDSEPSVSEVLRVSEVTGYDVSWIMTGKIAGDRALKQVEKPEEPPAHVKPQPAPDPLLTAFPAGAIKMKPRPAKIANPEWWQNDSPTWQVTGGAAAGSPDGGWQGDEYHDEAVVPPEGITLVPVGGDSMEPLLLPGQYALIDKEREGFEVNGGLVVAVIVGNDNDMASQTYVKRCYVENDVYRLVSINKQYQPFAVKRSQCRIWPVIGTWYAGKGKPPRED